MMCVLKTSTYSWQKRQSVSIIFWPFPDKNPVQPVRWPLHLVNLNRCKNMLVNTFINTDLFFFFLLFAFYVLVVKYLMKSCSVYLCCQVQIVSNDALIMDFTCRRSLKITDSNKQFIRESNIFFTHWTFLFRLSSQAVQFSLQS